MERRDGMTRRTWEREYWGDIAEVESGKAEQLAVELFGFLIMEYKNTTPKIRATSSQQDPASLLAFFSIDHSGIKSGNIHWEFTALQWEYVSLLFLQEQETTMDTLSATPLGKGKDRAAKPQQTFEEIVHVLSLQNRKCQPFSCWHVHTCLSIHTGMVHNLAPTYSFLFPWFLHVFFLGFVLQHYYYFFFKTGQHQDQFFLEEFLWWEVSQSSYCPSLMIPSGVLSCGY